MAAVKERPDTGAAPQGGQFLFSEVSSEKVMTPEAFTEEQKLYFKTAEQFAREQVVPKSERIEKKDHALLRELLAKAGELGLLMIDIPEAYGGLGLDKTTSLLVAEAQSIQGSWSVTFGAHVGIGTLPIAWFGSAEQKQKYLPKLATGEWIAAYALTETGSGSDALGAKTRAALSGDGSHYVLNGSKQFITNAAFADVFVVFAKIDGDKFTAFIVDKDTPGLSIGAEEHKMGIRGSSTCALTFEDARVPAKNLLGEVGKGHKIAFNILNLGRLKLGASVVGAMKYQLEKAIAYAQERKQFQTPISAFPLIREKLARMASSIYAVESMAYRTSGLIDALLAKDGKAAKADDQKTIAAIEEFAIEASILKVSGSEAHGQLVDDAVLIHGGYGFIEEYAPERAYRDARINRLFEGTNEINRMLITGMLLKRTMRGQLPLFEAAQTVENELTSKTLPKASPGDPLGEEARTTELVKRMAIYALKVAAETFGPEIEKRQDLLAAVADIVIDAFALDSMISRAQGVAVGDKVDPVRAAMIRLYAIEAQARAVSRARRVLCGAAEGEALTRHLEKLALLDRYIPYDQAEPREAVVSALLAAGGYQLG